MLVPKNHNFNSLKSAPQQPQNQHSLPRNGTSAQNQQQQQMMSQLHQQLQQQQLNEGIISNQNIGGGMQNQNGPKMRENLHFAADNVSSAMTSLVRELNTGAFFMNIS